MSAFAEVKQSILQPGATVGSYSLIVDSVLGYCSVAELRVTVTSSLEESTSAACELPPSGSSPEKKKTRRI